MIKRFANSRLLLLHYRQFHGVYSYCCSISVNISVLLTVCSYTVVDQDEMMPASSLVAVLIREIMFLHIMTLD